MAARELYDEWAELLFSGKKPPSDWPKSYRSMAKRLKNLRRNLLTVFDVNWHTDRHTKITMYQFWPKEEINYGD